MMKYIFNHLDILNNFKKDFKTAITSDIDGTISKIALTPTDAIVSNEMKDLLIKLKKKYFVSVISGRPAKDAKKLVGVDGILYVGNHGLEFLKNEEVYLDPAAEKYQIQVQKAVELIENDPDFNINGIIIENKGTCFSIHYRCCINPEEVKNTILRLLGQRQIIEGLKITHGRKIIEIRPPVGYNKGEIIEYLVNKYNLQRIVYLGDDITDADAFLKLQELEKNRRIKSVGILVISDEIPYRLKKIAKYYLKDVDEVLKLFQWMTQP